MAITSMFWLPSLYHPTARLAVLVQNVVQNGLPTRVRRSQHAREIHDDVGRRERPLAAHARGQTIRRLVPAADEVVGFNGPADQGRPVPDRQRLVGGKACRDNRSTSPAP